MTTLREAAQQALEALEYHVEQTRPIWKTSEAIAALEAALAKEALHIDTLRMAREAGFAVEDGGVYTPDAYGPGDVTQLVKRFADLVSAAEREACAKVCDLMEQQAEGTECCKWPTPIDCAANIRARKDKQ